MVSFHILLLDRAGNNLVNADFSPYSRMFFAVKHIYLTLYIVYALRISPIYSVPACSRACSLCLLSVRPRGRVAVLAALAVCAAVPVCACRYLVNGGLFSPPSLCGLPCLPACVLAALAPCAWPRLLPLFASFHSPIMYILRRYARLARRVVRSAHSAANFFEIVFKPLISVQLSSA